MSITDGRVEVVQVGVQGPAGPTGPAGEYTTLAELNTDITDATLDDSGDPRTPTAHAASHATGGSDPITPADIGAATAAQGALADTALQSADIDTFAELNAIVADAALVSTDATQTLTGKTLNAFTNDIEADSIHEQVRNDSGATLNPLTPVYATGYNVGQELVTVDACDADDPAKMPCIGLVETSIGNNASGAIVTTGRLKDVDTSSYSVGDILFVSTTAGALTNVRPTSGVAQAVGIVVRSHASAGIVFALTDLVTGILGLSGSDSTLITGTAGTSGNLVQWNADGDAVDAGYAVGAVPTVSVASTRNLALTDANRELVVNSGSAVVLTIPTNASVAFPTATKIALLGIGAGTVTITADTGVTLNGVSAGSGALSAQYSAVVLTKIGTDAWVINGDHGAVA